jgi:hypothetical protein
MLVFFGHQSVGGDLIEGLRLGTSGWVGVHAADYLPGASHTVIHECIGRNRDPLSKLDDFSAWVQGDRLPALDVALLKFCYVDVCSMADAERLWPVYRARLQELARACSGVRFVHCTIPLRRLPSGPYAFARRLLGHKHPEVMANRARESFNARLRETYGPAGHLFDLAALEATRPDGRACRHDGVPGLAPDWTYDGGHLNARGRTMAASAFVAFLHSMSIAPDKTSPTALGKTR